jgi:hypothetical protein
MGSSPFRLVAPTSPAYQGTEPPLSEEATIALSYIAEHENIPVVELQVVGEETLTFPNLNRTYTLVTLIHDRPEAFRSFSILVDPDTGEVEPDVDKVRAEEAAAVQAKYGKLDATLYEHLQGIEANTLVQIAVWAAATDAILTPTEIEEELAQIYPEGREALEKHGVVWAVDDPDLRNEIQQKYNQRMAEETAKQVAPVVRWLEERGYAVDVLAGTPSLTATVSKQDILLLSELDAVGMVYQVGFEGEPAAEPPFRVYLPNATH